MIFDEYIENKRESSVWKNYCNLMQTRPECFVQSEELMIETDLVKICEFEIKSKREIGVVYESRYNMMIVDLVYGRNGKYFCYERVLPAVSSGAIVSVPVYENKFILLNQFRHSMRGYQLSFPRGFGERGISPEENLSKELYEELGVEVRKYSFLGKVVADSGLSGNQVDVYYCDVSCPKTKVGYEGIKEIVMLSKEEMKDMICKRKITDGYTLSAFTMWQVEGEK